MVMSGKNYIKLKGSDDIDDQENGAVSSTVMLEMLKEQQKAMLECIAASSTENDDQIVGAAEV